MITPSSLPIASVPGHHSAARIGRCLDAVESTSGFIVALRNCLEDAATAHDNHLVDRTYICDYVERKLRKVMSDLEYIRGIIQPIREIES